jgi:hypothetical protein
MGAIWKKGKANTIAIDLGRDDIYGLDGATFQCFYGNPDGTTTEVGDFAEFIKPIDNPQTCKANGDTTKGNTDIPVDDVTGFEKGMVVKVKDKDIYFYVEAVDTDNNILTARKPISGDIADGDELDQVGNTGVYGRGVTIDTVGIHFFVISNPSIGLMNKSTKVEVVEHDEEDIYSKLDTIENKLDSLGGVDGVIIA